MTTFPSALTGAASGVRRTTAPVLRWYQKELKHAAYDAWAKLPPKSYVLVVSATGSGKCLAKGTPVLMFDGTVKPVEEVCVDDRLMGPDSQPRTVLSLARGREQMYRVTPVKGAPYDVNESHILSLKICGGSSRVTAPDGRVYAPGDVVDISVRDYLRASKTFRHMAKGYRVPVEFSDRPAPATVPPYVLGAWLGDGTEKRTACLTSIDAPVIAAWSAWGESLGLRVREECQKHTECSMYFLSGRKGAPNAAVHALMAVGVYGLRNIPLAYRTACRRDRLELLAGLLDTDGYLHRSGYDYVTKSERLAGDIAFLCRSLGFACYVKSCTKTCTNTGATGNYFRLSISGDLSVVPCRVERRKAPPRRQVKDVLLTGISVSPLEVDDYYGFCISGDRRFVLGDFTVTHNTVLLSSVVFDHDGCSCVMAHRQELIGQISMALARNGIRHRILAPDPLIRAICKDHLDAFGICYYDANAKAGVASVQSLTPSRIKREAKWLQQVTLVIVDEAAHCLKANTWGKACEHFPNAKGLGVTATPCRGDGKGLGKHADGIFDTMVVGPPMLELIRQGYLCGYRKIGATIHIDLAGVKVGSNGDYVLDKGDGKKAVRASPIVAGCVEKYKAHADSMQAIVFASDLETAEDMAQAFRDAGIPAEMLDATTPDLERRAAMRRFRDKVTRVILNKDLFSEGLDIAGVECVILARPTLSFGLHAQQVGRALRLAIAPELMREWDNFTVEERLTHIAASAKPQAVVIDLVGNLVARGLGPPERRNFWTLDADEKKSKSGPDDVEQNRYCLNPECLSPYLAYLKVCPHCKQAPKPSEKRSSPDEVEGDLTELDEGIFDALYGPIAAIAMSEAEFREQPHIRKLPLAWAQRNVKAHYEHRLALETLQNALAWWAGEQRQFENLSNAEIYRKFWQVFGTDWLTCQAQDRQSMEKLTGWVMERLTPASLAGMLGTEVG